MLPRRSFTFPWAAGAVALAGVLSSFGVEALWRTREALFAWPGQFPAEATLNAAIGVFCGLVFLALTGRALIAIVLNGTLLTVLGLVHSTKMATIGKPLYPWDVFLYREAAALVPSIAPWVWGVLTTVAVVALAAALRWGPAPISFKSRGALIAGLVVVALMFGTRPDKRLKGVVQNRRWVQNDNYRINGVLLAFGLNLNNVAVERPPRYDAGAVRAAASLEPRFSPVTAVTPPAVIAVMSESFFDPTVLPGVRFNEDPVPNLHRLQREASSGVLYAPVFGGGTANTEFEFLTGHSMNFLPSGSIPYQQYVRRKHASLASIFGAAGYRTVAVHNFHRWFWERESVYRHFGFHRFVGLEDMKDAPIDGVYPSDAALTSHLVAEFEAEPSAPLFLFGVSMEAHGPYTAVRAADSPFEITGPLDEAASQELLAYVTSAHHADRELGALVAYLEKVQRPVFLVFFGDHQPSLPLALSQTGVASSLADFTFKQKQVLHRVPLVIWTNTGQPRRDLGALSPSFLSPMLLELTGTRGSRYTDFLRGVHRQMPVFMRGLVADASGEFFDEVPPRLRELEQSWWTLEYDALFGEDYLSAEEEVPAEEG